jgi:hypothetical protein
MSKIILSETQSANLQTVLSGQAMLTASEVKSLLLSVDGFTNELATLVADSILLMPDTTASKVASIVGEAEVNKSFLGSILSKFRKPSPKPKYVRVDKVEAIVKDAIEEFSKPAALTGWETEKPDLSGW